MADTLKYFPFITKEEYMWSWTIPQIRLMSYDFTHTDYDEEGDDDSYDKMSVSRIDSAEDLFKDLGLPTNTVLYNEQ